MNLRGMKKVHEDNERAIFKNQRGHEVRVAKKGISKRYLDELNKLPLYSADGADLGGLEQASPPQSIEQAEAPQVRPYPPMAAAQNNPNQLQTLDQAKEQEAQKHAQEQNQEAAAHWNDLLQGHIKPETYKSFQWQQLKIIPISYRL